jgi:hypothetical protein
MTFLLTTKLALHIEVEAGAGKACQKHQVHLLLNQVASKVQDTGGGSYLSQSYSNSQAQEAGPARLQPV